MADKDFVNEAFVDELLKSGVWDIARVDRGTRDDEELDEALVSERGGKKGDEGAGKDKGDKPDFTTDARKGDKGKGKDKDDKPDFTTDARKGDKSKTKKGKKDYEDEDENGDDEENGNGKNESISARELAEELLDKLSEDVILEFIDLLYKSVLNEEADPEEDGEDDEEESE
jgi:hypothetical protein